ncbi:hypothetical protein [Azohydromonas lata]|uniref:DUF2783 domain-containing protein n=1 Tax=Azohydromonas lata TaxID=45677 RepID=A0ABU5IPZ7_9BURK|nr:hypothetical protein [Azohydromonas lata]MDZ5460962.1 DUF2783 domain-containing protein [Azohydromonas lata]
MSTHQNAANELTIPGLETVYDRLATAIDAAGDKSELFLVKLALLNANALGNPDAFIQQVDAALRDL